MRATVLLVQDDQKLSRRVAEALYVVETDVIQCATVKEAVSALENSPDIKLVLTDVHVPGLLNGYELAQIIRVFKPRLPIIMTSAGVESRPEKLPSSSTLLRTPWSVDDLMILVAEQLGEASTDSSTTGS